ncbi:TolC family protein [Alkalispirochaeta alkalica]|uniref:TolC family protein n=1 Tax=Alkalispirochaeta alkalica TaxID=46356 RepID=UPI00036E751F|nr:TolC family protein [Alkalispirochaeta alkalica]
MTKTLVRSAIAGVLLLAPLSGQLFAQETLDLAAFINLVESYSRDLEQARTDRSLAATQERAVRSQLFPSVGAQVGYARNLLEIEQSVPAFAEGNGSGPYPIRYRDVTVSKDNDFSLGISLEQNIFNMSVFRGLEVSRQFTSFTGRVYETAHQEIITAAKQLFFQTLLLQEVLRVRESSEEIAQENYRDALRRYETGVASRLEALQAEVNWKMTQPNTTQARRNLQIALEHLKNMAGLPRDRELSIEGTLETYPDFPDTGPAWENPALRPDFQMLLSKKRMQELNVEAQRAAYYPNVTASVNYGGRASSDGFSGFSSDDWTDTFTLGLTLAVPIYYGGSRPAAVRQAQLELTKTQIEISQRESDISTELQNIRLTLQEAQERIESARQTMATAEEAFEVTENFLENGMATQLDLKDARVSLEQARLSYFSAVFDYLNAYFSWQRATGRGSEIDPFL